MTLPLVLLPGLLCDQRLFHHQVAFLSPFVPLIMGDLTLGASIEEMASRLLKQLPSQFAVAGFSMGGYVALEMMRQEASRIQRIAFLNTTYRSDHPDVKKRREDFIRLAQMGRFQGVTPQFIPHLIDKSHLHDANLKHLIIQMAKDLGKDVFIAQEKAILDRKDNTSVLSNIKVPTLIIGGQSDQVTPPEHQASMHRLVAHSKLFLLENAGHVTPLEKPAEVSRLLADWLGFNDKL